jgi:ubiquitin-like protein Pup
MAEQERRTGKRREPAEDSQDTAKAALAEKGETLKKSLDEILDEIDTVLEENAEELVKNYIQRGGP